MADFGGSGRNSRFRNYDTPVNLVPYIDLMITIITFLMMTAVWTQLSSLQVQNAAVSSKTKQSKVPDTVTVTLLQSGLRVQVDGKKASWLPRKKQNYQLAVLRNKLSKFKNQDEKRFQVNVRAADLIAYSHVVKVIDVATGVGLTGVTLTPYSGT